MKFLALIQAGLRGPSTPIPFQLYFSSGKLMSKFVVQSKPRTVRIAVPVESVRFLISGMVSASWKDGR